nr:DUF6404 family protein [Thalassotalea piscium]
MLWFTQWSEQNMSIVTAIVSSLVSGILFGLIMAWYYQYSAKENNLSDWQQL